MNTKIKGVFFDCWDTLISFHLKNNAWNWQTLKDHAINREEINWDDVNAFCDDFYHKYYTAHLDFEVKVEQVLNLFCLYFGIQLDCPLSTCVHEILTHLDPKPVKGIDEFLTYLDEEKIPYACLSNTIYTEEDTRALIEKLVPGNHHFQFVLASGDVAVKKPNPVFFQTGVKMAKLDIKDCIYIGDKLLQDAYGSYTAGFGASIFLDWKNEVEKQSKYMTSIDKDINFPHVRVESYQELKERILNDEL